MKWYSRIETDDRFRYKWFEDKLHFSRSLPHWNVYFKEEIINHPDFLSFFFYYKCFSYIKAAFCFMFKACILMINVRPKLSIFQIHDWINILLLLMYQVVWNILIFSRKTYNNICTAHSNLVIMLYFALTTDVELSVSVFGMDYSNLAFVAELEIINYAIGVNIVMCNRNEYDTNSINNMLSTNHMWRRRWDNTAHACLEEEIILNEFINFGIFMK